MNDHFLSLVTSTCIIGRMIARIHGKLFKENWNIFVLFAMRLIAVIHGLYWMPFVFKNW